MKLRLLLLLLLPVPLFAQTGAVTGVALDSIGNTVAGATITVCPQGSSGIPCSPVTASTTSNGQGAFSVTVPVGTYTVTVFRTGIISTSSTVVVAPSNITVANNVTYSGSVSFTGAVTYTGAVSVNSPGSLTVSGTTTLTGDTRLSNVGTFNVQEWVGTNQYPTIASAITAASAGTVIHIPVGTFQISGTQNITQPNTKIVCDGIDAGFIQITSATANYFSIQASGFELSNCTLNSSVTRTGGFVVVNGSSAGFTEAYLHDLKLTDTYGGFQFVASTGAVAGVRFRNIIHKTTAGNHSGSLFVFGGGTSSVADIGLEGVYTPSDGATYDAPQIIFDTLLDTVHMWDYDVGFSFGVAQTQNVIKFQNTGAGVPPKFIRIEHMSIEGGGSVSSSDCINVAAVADLDISDSYVANCGNEGINISGGNNLNGPIRIHHNWIGNNQKGGLYISTAITAQTVALQVDGNSFNDNGLNTTNTFDDIQLAANTVGFDITNNHFGNEVFHNANKSRYGINVISGTSNQYLIANNSCDTTQIATACLLDAGTGANKTVASPNLFITWAPSAGSSAPTLTMQDTAGRCGFLAGPESVNNMQFGTCNTGSSIDIYTGNKTIAGSVDASQNWIFKGPAARAKQHISDFGSICTNGELALSAGWQSTGSATVTAVAGNGQTCSWTITTGTTTAANPTVTDTLTNALPSATTRCWMFLEYGPASSHTAAAGEGFAQTTLSATAPIFTFNGTPTAAGKTYLVVRTCGP